MFYVTLNPFIIFQCACGGGEKIARVVRFMIQAWHYPNDLTVYS